jgi:hypothetical protein
MKSQKKKKKIKKKKKKKQEKNKPHRQSLSILLLQSRDTISQLHPDEEEGS